MPTARLIRPASAASLLLLVSVATGATASNPYGNVTQSGADSTVNATQGAAPAQVQYAGTVCATGEYILRTTLVNGQLTAQCGRIQYADVYNDCASGTPVPGCAPAP